MDVPTGTWLSQLILAHLDPLAAQAVTTAQAQVPWYREIGRDRLHTVFKAAYATLATIFPANDLTPMRQYMEQVIAERLQQGAPAEGLIHVATILEAGVLALIDQEREAAPQHTVAATRQMQVATKNLLLIISGINLRVLSKLPSLPPHS